MGFWLRLLLLFSRQVVSHSLWTHGLQHARLLCPLLFLRVCSNSCPLSRWCYLTAHLLLPFSPFAFSLSLSIRIFSNELALRIRWSKHWSFSFSISPSNEYLGLRFPPPYHRCENDSLVKFGIRETSYRLHFFNMNENFDLKYEGGSFKRFWIIWIAIKTRDLVHELFLKLKNNGPWKIFLHLFLLTPHIIT